ncbi:MAG: hypothetical protein HY648_02500 [Acidobacteria bacterium]|nr:hypothetical protein [Acidobacteriota bacterium]
MRIRALEAQLDVSQRELAEAKRQSQEQFRSLQAERKDAEKQLAAKDQELETLLRQANQAQQRAHQSESALQEANSRIVRFSEELAERSAQFEQLRSHSTAEETSKGATSPREQSGLSSPGAVNDFYQQAVSTLTVILAAADLLAMNRRLDPSLQETAREIRAQGEKVLSLIKGITHPEETRRAEKGA